MKNKIRRIFRKPLNARGPMTIRSGVRVEPHSFPGFRNLAHRIKRFLRLIGIAAILVPAARAGTISPATTISISTVMAYQGGTWTIATAPPSGSQTVTPGTGTWSNSGSSVTIYAPNGNTTAIPTSLASLPALVSGTANIGLVSGSSVTAYLVPGSSISVTFPNAQPVSLATIPALAAGSANVGTVSGSSVTAFLVPGSSVSVTFPSAQPVSLASVPSHDVTNAGTFPVQAAATLAAETTKVIGTVNMSAGQSIGLAAGANTIGNVGIIDGEAISLSSAASFVAWSTASVGGAGDANITAATGTVIFSLLNSAPGTKNIKITDITVGIAGTYSTRIGTGTIGVGITFISTVAQASVSSRQIRAMDTADPALDANVMISTGGLTTASSYIQAYQTQVSLSTSIFSNQTPSILYHYDSASGNRPITIHAGEGFAVMTSSTPRYNPGGIVNTTVIFRQE